MKQGILLSVLILLLSACSINTEKKETPTVTKEKVYSAEAYQTFEEMEKKHNALKEKYDNNVSFEELDYYPEKYKGVGISFTGRIHDIAENNVYNTSGKPYIYVLLKVEKAPKHFPSYIVFWYLKEEINIKLQLNDTVLVCGYGEGKATTVNVDINIDGIFRFGGNDKIVKTVGFKATEINLLLRPNSHHLWEEEPTTIKEISKEDKEKWLAAYDDKLSYETGISYEQLLDWSNKYKNCKVKFTGKVIGMATRLGTDKFYLEIENEKIILCTFSQSNINYCPQKNDIIIIYGTMIDLVSLKDGFPFPSLSLDYIDIIPQHY